MSGTKKDQKIQVTRTTRKQNPSKSIIGIKSIFLSNKTVFAEMCDRLGEDVAHGTLLLRPMW